MRILLGGLAALGLAACSPSAAQAPPAPIALEAQSVPLWQARPEVATVGAFTYAGGLELKGPPGRRFGGLSDLDVDEAGRLTAVSDEGELIRARLVLDDAGRLTGLADATVRPLAAPDGGALKGKIDADSEGLAIRPDGEILVSFERRDRIWAYSTAGRPRALPSPKVRLPDNEGLEGLALAPSQGPDAYWAGSEDGQIWLCREAGGCRRWPGLPGPAMAYRLTALSETPDGDLVILHHTFNPLNAESRAAASIVALPRRPRQRAEVRAQLALAPPLAVDNFEGVAAVRGPGGGLRLYLVSDDNFSQRQRMLLFAFDWAGSKAHRQATAAQPPVQGETAHASGQRR